MCAYNMVGNVIYENMTDSKYVAAKAQGMSGKPVNTNVSLLDNGLVTGPCLL